MRSEIETWKPVTMSPSKRDEEPMCPVENAKSNADFQSYVECSFIDTSDSLIQVRVMRSIEHLKYSSTLSRPCKK